MKWTQKEGFRKPRDISRYLNGFKLGEIKVVAVNGWHTRDQVVYVGYEPATDMPDEEASEEDDEPVPEGEKIDMRGCSRQVAEKRAKAKALKEAVNGTRTK
jgi:hypothetical protein